MSIFEVLYYEEKNRYIDTIRELQLEVENLREEIFEKDMINFSKENGYSFNSIGKAIQNGNDLKQVSFEVANAFDLIEKYGLRKFVSYFRRVELKDDIY